MTKDKVMNRQEARKLGYKPLTHAYDAKKEGWMLAGVMGDMARGGIDAVKVKARDGVEIWRKGMHVVGKLRDYSSGETYWTKQRD